MSSGTLRSGVVYDIKSLVGGVVLMAALFSCTGLCCVAKRDDVPAGTMNGSVQLTLLRHTFLIAAPQSPSIDIRAARALSAAGPLFTTKRRL